MARIIDYICAHGVLMLNPYTQEVHTHTTAGLVEMVTLSGMTTSPFQQAEVFVIDNVADYLYAGTDQEEWDARHFPNVAPPHPVFWTEFRAPKTLRSEGTVRSFAAAPYATGCLFIAHTLADLRAMGATQSSHAVQKQLRFLRNEIAIRCAQEGLPPLQSLEEFHAWPQDIKRLVVLFNSLVAHQDMTDEALLQLLHFHWKYTVFLFIQASKNAPVFLSSFFNTALVKHDGLFTTIDMPYSDPDTVPKYNFWSTFFPRPPGLSPAYTDHLTSVLDGALFPSWLALSFLHCKNVTTTAVDPCHTRKPAKHRQACRRFHYSTLNIRPMQQVLRHEGASDHTGLQRALHICRGHFKDYTAKGLFGRNHGIYWWESRLRGTSKVGIREKHYNVHTLQQSHEEPPHA